MAPKDNNIDARINKVSFEIVNEKIVNENQINKMLGILTNDGVYAWWVYTKKELDWKFVNNVDDFKNQTLIKLLLSLEKLFNKKIIEDKIDDICKKQNEIETLKKEMKNIKDGRGKQEKSNPIQKGKSEIQELKRKQNESFNEFFNKLSEDLHSLLFFRDILEETLIYARYHAKALGGGNE